MTNKKVARKYNLALYFTAEETNSTNKVKQDLDDIKRSIEGSKELSNFILTPVISAEKKTEVFKAMFQGKVNELTLKFLVYLCEKNRINLLYDITEDFQALVNEKQGIVLAKVKTAVEINEAEKNALIEKLKLYTGKDIKAAFTVDPAIKGGFIASVDDKIIDASIIRQLELLKERFSMGSFNN
ncbi:MAG TPA: ATP synthase F1 subunit delta [Ignavibacteria bacterium]|nr:ATP synthase F1 subunit delta [Bacteroidota bacterium]HRE11888.1 ATP synthase F1 subunit delta [Ignavibacteria bacterium]HRF64983.1 ATP synthase F1 subunit delta [Ignavibacteria bacterium]HRJ03410.1 ATP synthase F1 subunit delta [Ignavibacteria bacterium]HRJ85531.1 ATP synthase F1 subunit delta [Ignavibacteria bacterium]